MKESGPNGRNSGKTAPDVAAIESLLRELSGVMSARVVIDDWGAVQEVHLLASNERSPKAIVRDVESALQARWGLAVDHKRVSVAQLSDYPRPPRPLRLTLRRLKTERELDQTQARVVVELAAGSHPGRWTGEAEGMSSARNLIRLAAEATLQALNRALPRGYRLDLSAQQEVPLGGYTILLTVVHLVTPEGVEPLAGAALIHEERVDASARSCLDAVNRRLGTLLPYAEEAGPDWGADEVAAAGSPE